MRLFDDPLSGNCYKIRMLLARLGDAYERVPVDVDGGETRSPAFLARNPYGKVPALETPSGDCLVESNAILCHLAEGTPWLPPAGVDRTRVMQWLFWEQNAHEPTVAVCRLWVKFLPPSPERMRCLPGLQEEAQNALTVMEHHLAKHDWLAARRFTIADTSLYAHTHLAEEGGLDLTGFPALRAWLDRVASQPGHIAMSQ